MGRLRRLPLDAKMYAVHGKLIIRGKSISRRVFPVFIVDPAVKYIPVLFRRRTELLQIFHGHRRAVIIVKRSKLGHILIGKVFYFILESTKIHSDHKILVRDRERPGAHAIAVGQSADVGIPAGRHCKNSSGRIMPFVLIPDFHRHCNGLSRCQSAEAVRTLQRGSVQLDRFDIVASNRAFIPGAGDRVRRICRQREGRHHGHHHRQGQQHRK